MVGEIGARLDGQEKGPLSGFGGVLKRTKSPSVAQTRHAVASKESFALVGKQSPHVNGSPLSGMQAPQQAQHRHGLGQPSSKKLVLDWAVLPGGLRPTTSMSLRDRAYLKSSMGAHAGEKTTGQTVRPPLPKVKPIPPLNLDLAVGLMGVDNSAQYKDQKPLKLPPKMMNDLKIKMMGLPPRPSSQLGLSSAEAERHEALQVVRPHSVSSSIASSPLKISFADQMAMHGGLRSGLSSAHTIVSQQSPSRSATPLEPLRLNTAELVRQNEILRQENEELRQLMLDAPGTAEQRPSCTAASRRSGILTALSNRSTLSSTWNSTNRSGVYNCNNVPQTAGSHSSNSLLTDRSGLSAANSIKFIQGGEAPANKRIKALEAEIKQHQQHEEDLRAALLAAANSQPMHRHKPITPSIPLQTIEEHAASHSSKDLSISNHHTSKPAQLMVSLPSTSHSAKRAARLSSVARTSGNLTPYPREATASSTDAVVGARLGQEPEREGEGEREPNAGAKSPFSRATFTGLFAEDSSATVPVTRAGPHVVSIAAGNNEWLATGQKLDPSTSTVAMSNTMRLTYPKIRLQTVAYGGGGSYAYGVVGRGPIMVAQALPLPDGKMVRSPDSSLRIPASVSLGGEGEEWGDSGATTASGTEKPKVKRGDKEANSWHATLASSALRWEVRTPHLTMPVPSKAVQQDGHLAAPTTYGYDAPSKLSKWANAGSAAYTSMLMSGKQTGKQTGGSSTQNSKHTSPATALQSAPSSASEQPELAAAVTD